MAFRDPGAAVCTPADSRSRSRTEPDWSVRCPSGARGRVVTGRSNCSVGTHGGGIPSPPLVQLVGGGEETATKIDIITFQMTVDGDPNANVPEEWMKELTENLQPMGHAASKGPRGLGPQTERGSTSGSEETRTLSDLLLRDVLSRTSPSRRTFYGTSAMTPRSPSCGSGAPYTVRSTKVRSFG